MNLWLGFFIVTFCVVAVLVIVFFARSRIKAGGLFTDSDRAAGAFGVLGTAFAVLLAFVIFFGLRELRDREREVER